MQRVCSILRGVLPPLVFFFALSSISLSSSIKGRVERIDYPVAVIISSNRTFFVRLGPFWFWEGKNCTLSKGDLVAVEGWVVDDFLIPRAITSLSKNCTVKLRDSKGYPLWRGGRRRK